MLFSALISSFLGFLLLCGFPFFFYGGPGYHSTRSFQALWDLGHILFFAIATVWLFRLLRKRIGRWAFPRLLLFFFVGILIFGVVVECLQMSTGGRSPDIMDVLRNQLGCLIAFAWYIRPDRLDRALAIHRFFRSAVLFLLLLAALPLARALIDEHLAAQQFPVLADFETPFEQTRWVNDRQMHKETTLVRHGKTAMRVQLSTAKYSGIALFHFPGNWQGYYSLHCSVYNTQSTTLPLNLRINDLEHKQHGSEFADRFNKTFPLQPGWNELVVDLNQVRNAPKGRKMDMAHIEGFGIFVVQQAKPIEIIIDHVFLAR
ncbi:MAG: VanZ family protein [Desulfobulbus sp.]|nr:VanZ family protein [Desulfobulbus sp.]